MNTHDKGRQAENIACNYLQQQGFCIMARNFYYQKAEIDIIAAKDDLLIIVEVKWRTSDFHGAPHEFVTPKKRKLLAKAAQEFVEKKQWQGETRFDIISLTGSLQKHKLDHIEEAFYFF